MFDVNAFKARLIECEFKLIDKTPDEFVWDGHWMNYKADDVLEIKINSSWYKNKVQYNFSTGQMIIIPPKHSISRPVKYTEYANSDSDEMFNLYHLFDIIDCRNVESYVYDFICIKVTPDGFVSTYDPDSYESLEYKDGFYYFKHFTDHNTVSSATEPQIEKFSSLDELHAYMFQRSTTMILADNTETILSVLENMG